MDLSGWVVVHGLRMLWTLSFFFLFGFFFYINDAASNQDDKSCNNVLQYAHRHKAQRPNQPRASAPDYHTFTWGKRRRGEMTRLGTMKNPPNFGWPTRPCFVVIDAFRLRCQCLDSQGRAKITSIYSWSLFSDFHGIQTSYIWYTCPDMYNPFALQIPNEIHSLAKLQDWSCSGSISCHVSNDVPSSDFSWIACTISYAMDNKLIL